MKNEIDVFVPVAIDLDWPTAESVIACIKEQNHRYGFTHFFLACPGGGEKPCLAGHRCGLYRL